MKFTNINNLIIKFMGGGLIKFPSRFLKWIKVDGKSDDDSGGGSQAITPEFIEEHAKDIMNFGLSEEEINALPTFYIDLNTQSVYTGFTANHLGGEKYGTLEDSDELSNIDGFNKIMYYFYDDDDTENPKYKNTDAYEKLNWKAEYIWDNPDKIAKFLLIDYKFAGVDGYGIKQHQKIVYKLDEENLRKYSTLIYRDALGFTGLQGIGGGGTGDNLNINLYSSIINRKLMLVPEY